MAIRNFGIAKKDIELLKVPDQARNQPQPP